MFTYTDFTHIRERKVIICESLNNYDYALLRFHLQATVSDNGAGKFGSTGN
jgi:hypothetical protein